ncbi:MAG: molybdenum cofactor guanylyltransferase [Bacillota bacterium]
MFFRWGDGLGVIILAGGASQRLGSDKSELTLGGVTLLERSLALARALSDKVLVVGRAVPFAVDLPFFPSALGLFLLERLEESLSSAVVPRLGPHWEPLAAAYHRSCLIQQTVARGEKKGSAFYGLVQVVPIGERGCRAFGDPARLFHNINTPEEAALAEAWLSHRP